MRVLSGHYRGKSGAVKGEYVPVQYLDVALQPEAVWEYNQTPNDQTLFLYLIEGELAADEALQQFEQKACAMLLSSSKENGEPEIVRVKAGPEGARFLLLAAKPLREPIAWGGPIVMNSQEELDQAFADLRANTFIRHKQPKVY